MTVVPVKITQMLCASPNVVSNVQFQYGGGTGEDFDEDDMR